MRSDRHPARTKRTVVIVAALAIVVAGGLTAWLAMRPTAASTVAATSQVETVSTGTIQQLVTSTGTVEPAQQANLAFAVSGRVTAVDVTVGQTVTAGQTVATVDPTALSAAVAQAQATLAIDQAKLASDQSSSASAVQITADQAAITSAQAQVATAQSSLADATLTATIAGTVASANLSVGQQVFGGSPASGGGSAAAGSSAGGTSSSPATNAQFVIVSTGSYIVNATVDDTQVAEVQAGDQAVITGTGATGNIYGTVGSIGLVATQSSGVATFPVVVDVTGSPPGLYGGASADVSIIVKDLQGVIVVPTIAVHFSGSSTTVTVASGTTQVTRPVTVGIASRGNTQIVSGLSVGDRVVVPVIRFGGAGGTRARLGRGAGRLGGGAGGLGRGAGRLGGGAGGAGGLGGGGG